MLRGQMKQANLAQKLAAVACSALVLSGCLAHRSGTFDSLFSSGTQPEKETTSEDSDQPVHMSGTKAPNFNRVLAGVTPAPKSSTDSFDPLK
jgi:hypothetical protein